MLKVGDKVTIREDLEVDKIYGKADFCRSMKKYLGQEIIVKYVIKNDAIPYDNFKIDNCPFVFNERMIKSKKKSKQEVIIQMDCVESVGDINVNIDTKDILTGVIPYSIKTDMKFYKNKNVVTCIRNEGGIKGVGVSYCHPLDEFDYLTGLCIAECRANIDIENQKIKIAKKGR